MNSNVLILVTVVLVLSMYLEKIITVHSNDTLIFSMLDNFVWFLSSSDLF